MAISALVERREGQTLLMIDPVDLVWGIYARESKDQWEPGSDTAVQVEAQLKDLRPFALGVGGRIGFEFSEPDTSASRRRRVTLADGTNGYRVVRKKWDRLIELARRREVNAIGVDNLDRGLRDPRDLEDLIDLVEHHGIYVASRTGKMDLMTDDGISAARNEVAQRNKESRNTGRRIASGNRRAAFKGHVKGGGSRPYGWRKDKRRRNKRESEMIRKGMDRLLSGVRVATLTVEWNAKGVKTVTGSNWHAGTLEQIFSNPRLCGWRTYKGSVIHDDEGNPVRGDWEPILSVDEFERVQAVIKGRPVSRTRPTQGQRIRNLLTGIVRCGLCHGRMRGSAGRRKNGTYYRVYRCPSKSEGGCGGVTRIADPLELYIVELVKRDQRRRSWRGPVVAVAEFAGEQRLSVVRDLIQGLKEEFKAQTPGREISAGRFFATLHELETEEKELTAKKRRHDSVQVQRAARLDVSLEWDRPEFTLDQKRNVLAELFASIVVYPTRGPKKFDPSYIGVVWREDAPEDAPELALAA